MNNESIISSKLRENGARLGAGEDDGEPGGAADAVHPIDELQLPIEDVLIKKEQGAKGLILGGSGDGAVDGEMAEEGGDFFLAHLAWMGLVVKKDITPDPIRVGLLGAEGVMLDAEMPADAVEEFWGLGGGVVLKCGRDGARRSR